MKQLKDGGLGFYQNKWLLVLHIVVLGFMAAVGLQTIHFHFFIYLWLGMLGLFLLIFLIEYQKPLCVLYPDRFCAEKHSVFWPQLEVCYLQKRWVRGGKGKTMRQTLVLQQKDGQEIVVTRWNLLSSADKKKLLEELALRGFAQLPEKAPDHWLIKMRDSLKGKRK